MRALRRWQFRGKRPWPPDHFCEKSPNKLLFVCLFANLYVCFVFFNEKGSRHAIHSIIDKFTNSRPGGGGHNMQVT